MRGLHGMAVGGVVAALLVGGGCGGVKASLQKAFNEGQFWPVNVYCLVPGSSGGPPNGSPDVAVHLQNASTKPGKVTHISVSMTWNGAHPAGQLSKVTHIPLKGDQIRVVSIPHGSIMPSSCSVTDVKWRNA